MFGLRLPALAAAGAVAVLAVGGMSAGPAVADDGDTGTSSAVASGGTAGTAGATAGADLPSDVAADVTAGTDIGTDAGTEIGTDVGADTGTDLAGAGLPAAGPAPEAGAADPAAPADPAATATTESSGASAWTMDVAPQTVAPGGQVTLHLQASCTAGHKAKASAEVFVSAVTLAPASDGKSLEGNAFIKSDAAEGSYTVSVECEGETSSATATVTVVSGVTGGVTPTVPVTPPVTPAKPVKPVPAGGGGTAQLAAGPAVAGSSTGPLLVTGGFAAAGLIGLVVHRRRTAHRG
ncbi:hypothetical protein [Streptomyces sp.]|uniref:hypothetical protein n=1 Tax=Streptomyces sp. TaxID=1931 RepID=UPI002F3F8AAB